MELARWKTGSREPKHHWQLRLQWDAYEAQIKARFQKERANVIRDHDRLAKELQEAKRDQAAAKSRVRIVAFGEEAPVACVSIWEIVSYRLPAS